jgi:N4-gp56 family major capsid protein
MAYVDPPAGGIASDLVSPVSASQTPEGKLLNVGPRDSAGLPTGSNVLDTLITRAYDLQAYKFLRRRLVFADAATIRTTNQSHTGAVIRLNVVNDLDDDPTKALLVENYDVLPTPLASFGTDVILYEYGRVVTSTNLLRGTSMIPFDPIAAERVGRNAGATMDRLARDSLLGSTTGGGLNADGSANTAAPTDVTVSGKPSATLRAAFQSFQSNNIEPFANGLYRAYIDPASLTALKGESDAAGWRYYQINQDSGGGTGDIARGAIGVYEGFEIIVTTGVGASHGFFLGNEGLAMLHSNAPGFGPMPQVIVSPVVDRLRRFASVGWYWLGGFSRFRAEAVLIGNLAG